MPPTPIAYWLGFHLVLLLLLAAELLYARRPSTASATDKLHRTSIVTSTLWIVAALLFALFIGHTFGTPSATQFLAGYTIEQTLSVDNLFLFLLLFRLFKIPSDHQPKVLFWGVLGAILMRGLFIAAGLSLLARFQWVGYLFALLLLAAAVRLLMPEKQQRHDQTPRWIAWLSKLHPVAMRYDCFFTIEDGRRLVTMLFLALVAIEATDVVFALDSIPAVLSITRNPFLAYTSNIFAVMSLRSLFFLLAHMLTRLRFLHLGLAAILAFAAIKMLLATIYEIGPITSLAVIVFVLAITIAFSLARPKNTPDSRQTPLH